MEFMEGYKIVRYNPNFLDGTLEILKELWSKRFNTHEEHFKWKYHNSPYIEYPLGIVALHVNRVVGFRGYFATQWYTHGETFTVLVAGDTVVERSHRRNGLSTAMGNKACEEYGSRCKFFINLEANAKAVSGYLKLGFVPILDKRTLQRAGLAKHPAKIENVEVSKIPKPQEMQAAVSLTDKISLKQDEKFFQWRFKSKIPNTYLFYYYKDSGRITDYVIVGRLPNHDSGYILDYTENNLEALDAILRCILHTESLNMISIRNINLSAAALNMLKKYNFADNNLKNKNLCPILVRPVKKDFVENDWFVNGLDIRDINNWKLKGICSEWA